MRPGTYIPSEDLLADLQRVAEVVGRTPTKEEYEEHGEYAIRTYTRRFGLWSDAHREASLEPRECNNRTADNGPSAKYGDLEWSDLKRGGSA